jgi:hypothetical protein
VDITKSLPLAILKPIAQNITIYIGTLTGRKFSIECLSTDTVHFLKKRILEEERIAINAQILVFREKPLQKDSDTLGSLGIQNFSTIQLLIHMHGGSYCLIRSRSPSEYSSCPATTKCHSAPLQTKLRIFCG